MYQIFTTSGRQERPNIFSRRDHVPDPTAAQKKMRRIFSGAKALPDINSLRTQGS
jgi:hypothetical protein